MAHIRVFETCRNGQTRLTELEPVSFQPENVRVEKNMINVYEQLSYQTIDGFGGAFTEAGAYNLSRLPEETRRQVMEAYFSKDGLGLNFCRTHINSCDFCLDNYAYDNTPEDFDLRDFDFSHERLYLMPMIKQALALNPDLWLYASPWSPPGWMKTSGQMNGGGKLRRDCYDVWARYVVRYLEEYRKEGVNIWGVTVQNESNYPAQWDACTYDAEDERDLIRDHLGPTLQKAGLGDVKIMYWDHNKERIVDRALVTLGDAQAAQYIHGTAYHWYAGDHFDALSMTHQLFPDKKLYATENGIGRSKVYTWDTGERVAHGIIGDMNHFANGFTLWNLLLDEEGGPSHSLKDGRAPMMYDFRTGKLTIGSAYYYLGHFSKFVQRGAVRLGVSTFGGLEAAAFRNPDGSVYAMVLNREDEAKPFLLRTAKGLAEMTCKPHSILTLEL